MSIPSPILVTGAAGFIGYHLADRLLARGDTVIGVDNLSDYYDVSLKEARLSRLRNRAGFRFRKLDLADREATAALFVDTSPRRVVHLAAQPGVRYSLVNPHAYAESNLIGFLNVIEGCRHHGIEHFVYASSSSVYGADTKAPSSIRDRVDHPVSLYAATKKSNELMAFTYSHLFGIPSTGLRFFTVYGPWGRPDMAIFSFTRSILAGRPIDVYNHGRMRRDFTYIDDIVEGVVRVFDRPPAADGQPGGGNAGGVLVAAPYRLYNIGNHTPVELFEFIRLLEKRLGRTARLNLLPLQPGDVVETCADVSDLRRDAGFEPNTPLETGIDRFVAWYCSFYGDEILE